MQEDGPNGSSSMGHGTTLDAWDKCVGHRRWGTVHHIRHYRENGHPPNSEACGQHLDDDGHQGEVSVWFAEPFTNGRDVFSDACCQDSYNRVAAIGCTDPKRFNYRSDGGLKAHLVKAALEHPFAAARPLSGFENPLNVKANGSLV